MSDEFDNDPIARELRASLERHALEAPRGHLLAERIIETAGRPPARRTRPGWRTWTLPLVAATAVAGVVAAVVGIESYHPAAKGNTPFASRLGTGNLVQSPYTPRSGRLAAPASASAHVETSRLYNVKILDLTFVSENEGYALASAGCVHGTGRCSALFHTKGKQWWSLPNSTPFNVAGVAGGCTYRCVSNIRFANAEVGYVYGPSAFLMTQDGGQHWTPEKGGAIALETLDGNVIRVTASSPAGCPGPCNVQVETAAIGSSTWTPSDLAPVSGSSFGFVRGGPGNAYLLIKRNPAGSAQDETSTLYRSTDNGVHWSAVGERCPQTGGEVDSVDVAGGGTGVVSLLCRVRRAPQRWFVATSTDGGARFVPQPGKVPGATAQMLTSGSATVLVTAGDGLARSTDGGTSWHRVASVSAPLGFVGFESATVGRAVSADGKTIWTTRDAGKSWQPVTFG